MQNDLISHNVNNTNNVYISLIEFNALNQVVNLNNMNIKRDYIVSQCYLSYEVYKTNIGLQYPCEREMKCPKTCFIILDKREFF